jgi:uncharacterized repeat protein (TIGR04138 family)
MTMRTPSFEEAVERIRERDERFHEDAFAFVREALDVTLRHLDREHGARRHVTGQELLEGARRHALETYGPLAWHVLDHWGVRRTEDIGEIVFLLVESGVLGKNEDDRPEDFAGGYDFDEAFRAPYRARKGGGARRPAARRTQTGGTDDGT